MMRNMKINNVEIRRVVEYSALFPKEKPLDIIGVLKTFDRLELIKMATLVSLNYGNMSFPNCSKTLFSDISKCHLPYLNQCFEDYFGRIKSYTVQLITNRTALELFRLIFGIKVEEFHDSIKDEDKELMLFKVIVSLNEKVMAFQNTSANFHIDELLFLNSYLTNDCNNFSFKSNTLAQLLSFFKLIDFISSNEILIQAKDVLFEKWGVKSWREYLGTLLYLANETNKYYEGNQKGLPVIDVQAIYSHSEEGIFCPSLVQAMSIDYDEFIPYDDQVIDKNELNVDYRKFRERPFVKIGEGKYVAISIELICERIYNSLFFDFLPLIRHKKDGGEFFDYNKDFVEKYLFRNALWGSFKQSFVTYPSKANSIKKEDKNEPDFYARKCENIILFECKAIKMNGRIRDDGDYNRLLDELREKIVVKTKNLDQTRKQKVGERTPIGIGQLLFHINAIEDDVFIWDKNIPDAVVYYPILVLEDIRFIQPGLLSIINRWFYELVDNCLQLRIQDIQCRPVMVLSVPTLLLYNKFIKKRGMDNLIDGFLKKYAILNTNGVYEISPLADFDSYIRSFCHNREHEIECYFKDWLKRNS